MKEAYAAAGENRPTGTSKKDAQAEFKREWAMDKYEALNKRRRIVESNKQSDSFVARYRPFAVIVREEGGDQAAFTAACHYIVSAAKMHTKGVCFRGRPWSRYNSMTRRVEWLYVEDSAGGIPLPL